MGRIEKHKDKISFAFIYLGTFGICFIALCFFLIFIPYIFFRGIDDKPPHHAYIMLALGACECVNLILLGLWSNMSFKKNRQLKSYFQMISGAVVFTLTFLVICYWIYIISRSRFEINAHYFMQLHIIIYIVILAAGIAEGTAVFLRGLYHLVIEPKKNKNS